MKDKLIKSTLILLVGGCVTKILGMFIKMLMGRLVGTEALGLYMMILPTFSLFIGLGNFGLPTALSKLISEDKNNNKQLFFSVLPVSLLINIFLIIIIILIAPILANNFLRNESTYYGILAIAVVIPFISISGVCRAYFFGKEKMLPHVISNIIDDLVRLVIIVLFLPSFLKKNISYTICFLILINVVSEIASTLVLFCFLPKKIVFNRKDFIPNKLYIKESLSIGIPNTTGRLIGSIGYFLEPILLTNTLISVGYSSSFITSEYGILSGYVMPILLLPSFFTTAISQALLPTISKEYSNGRRMNAKRKLIFGICISLFIGVFFTCLFVLFPEIFLNIIYHTTTGVSYMRFLAPICLLQYIQAPLSTCLDAIGRSKDAMIANFLGMSVRTILLILFSLFKIGIWGLILAISINVLVITIYDLIKVKKAFNY